MRVGEEDLGVVCDSLPTHLALHLAVCTGAGGCEVEMVSYSDKVIIELGETQSTTQEFAIEVDVGGDESAALVDEVPLFNKERELAATKLQSHIRSKGERRGIVKHFMTQTGSCLAMPGTVQGHSGYYEMWANALETTLVAKFDVLADGQWAMVEGPYTQKEWVVVKVQNKIKNKAVLKIQALSRRHVERKALVKAMSEQLGQCLAMSGTIQGKSGYYEMWMPEFDTKMVAGVDVGEDNTWELCEGPWTTREWATIRKWTPEQRKSAETIKLTMEARVERRLTAKAMGETSSAVALAGTLQGGSGYYQLQNNGQPSSVARYDIGTDGQWMLIEGPWSMQKWEIVKQRSPEEERAAGEAGRHTFQAQVSSREHTNAASKVQSLYRARNDRRDVVKRLNEEGTCMALPGTVQGKQGYYEMWDDASKSTLAARFDVSEGDDWSLIEGPWTMREWSVVKKQTAQRKVMAAQRNLAASKVQAMCRGRTHRINLVRELGKQLGSCLAMPGTVQGRTGYYEMWADEQKTAMVAKFEVDVFGSWNLVAGPWLNSEWLVLKRSLHTPSKVPDDETPVQTAVRVAVQKAKAAAEHATRRSQFTSRMLKRLRRRNEDTSARMLQNFSKICKSKGVAYERRVEQAEQSSTLVPLPGTLQGKSGWFKHPWDESCIYYTRDEDGDFNEECRMTKFEWQSARKIASASDTLCAMPKASAGAEDGSKQLMMNKRG
jgi:hypothetical protein